MTNKPTIKQFKYLSNFSCLADKCPDNCCYGWDIKVDQNTYQLYEKDAPELLNFIDQREEGCFMKKDPEGSGNCIKLKDGLCNIASTYGNTFLSNTCTLYPRIRNQLDGIVMVSAELSCPEIARICLFEENPFDIHDGTIERPLIMDDSQAGDGYKIFLDVNKCFIDFCSDKNISLEQVILSIINTAKELEKIEKNEWSEAVTTLLPLSIKDGIEYEYNENDPYKLLQTIVIVLNAAKPSKRRRLLEALAVMENVFQIRINWDSSEIILGSNSIAIYENLFSVWKSPANKNTLETFRRYIQAELALNLFPYSNSSGTTISEQAMILSFKFAFIRLALIGYLQGDGLSLKQETIVKVIQGISRFLDHTREIKLLLSTYEGFGWDEEAHLKSMLFSYQS